MTNQGAAIDPQKVAQICALFEHLPEGLEERHARLEQIRNLFHEQVALALQGPLNQYIAQLPQDTLEEKSKVAGYVNGIHRSCGLAIRDPKSGRCALLVTDSQDAERPEVARYRFDT